MSPRLSHVKVYSVSHIHWLVFGSCLVHGDGPPSILVGVFHRWSFVFHTFFFHLSFRCCCFLFFCSVLLLLFVIMRSYLVPAHLIINIRLMMTSARFDSSCSRAHSHPFSIFGAFLSLVTVLSCLCRVCFCVRCMGMPVTHMSHKLVVLDSSFSCRSSLLAYIAHDLSALCTSHTPHGYCVPSLPSICIIHTLHFVVVCVCLFTTLY
jgi:hypothetical protein